LPPPSPGTSASLPVTGYVCFDPFGMNSPSVEAVTEYLGGGASGAIRPQAPPPPGLHLRLRGTTRLATRGGGHGASCL
jgi:hypothetical protein